jgi:hypothetical protein
MHEFCGWSSYCCRVPAIQHTYACVQWYDGNISLPGCDKNMPGALIAMGRVNRPALMVYGGTIRPGVSKLTGENLNIVDAFQSFGAFSAGKVTEEERFDQVRYACPGAGACGGMYTANTMASAIEALGMCLPFSSSIPAEDSLKMDECRCVTHFRFSIFAHFKCVIFDFRCSFSIHFRFCSFSIFPLLFGSQFRGSGAALCLRLHSIITPYHSLL